MKAAAVVSIFFSKVDEIHTNLKFQCKLYRISPDIDVKHATNHSSFDGDNAISLSDIPFNSCSVLPLTLFGYSGWVLAFQPSRPESEKNAWYRKAPHGGLQSTT